MPRSFRPLGLFVAILAAGCALGKQEAGRDPNTASRLDVAKAAEESGQTDVALSMYASAASAAPDNPVAQARYGAILIRAGRPQQAEYVISRALKTHPKSFELLTEMGNLRLSVGNPAEAVPVYDQALAASHDGLAALNGRAVAFDLLGRHQEAESIYRTILTSHPLDVMTSNNLAMCLILQGRPAEAVTILSSLASQGKAPQRVINNLGVAEAASGNEEAAKRVFDGRVDESDIRTIALSLREK